MSPEAKTRLRWLIVGSMIAGCVVGYGWAAYATRVHDRELREKVKHQREVLDLIGALEAERNKHPEEVTPALADDAKKARDAGAGAVAGIRIVTMDVPFAVPADCPVSPPPIGPGAGEVLTPPSPLPTYVTVDQQGLIFAQGDGVIRWKGITFATLKRGTWSQREELPVDSVQTEFAVDPQLEAAWKKYVAGLPWMAEFRIGVVGPDPGLRLGGSWYGKQRRWGLWGDFDMVQESTSTYNSYYETFVSGESTALRGAFGVGWRLGPR